MRALRIMVARAQLWLAGWHGRRRDALLDRVDRFVAEHIVNDRGGA